MSTTSEFERSMLDGKDREELHAIASAIGVKAATRMKKSDLVEAIVSAAGAPANGEAEKTKRAVRSRKDADVDPIAALAAEEAEIAARDARGSDENLTGQDGGVETHEPRRASRPIVAPSDSEAAPTGGGSAGTGRAESGTRPVEQSGDDGGFPGRDGADGEPGNRRRRRRRGRDHTFEGSEGRGEPEGDPVDVLGLLDLRDEGYGFLRTKGYLAGRHDVYVSASQVRRFALRKGDFIKGASRPQSSNEKYPALLRVDEINGMDIDAARTRVRFEDLTPLFPDSKLRLEVTSEPTSLTGRIVDLVSPIGKGQRGLIVSPPKAGKTTILKQLVYSIERNNPEVHLMVLLVDERPEEVTDMRRHVLRGEVVASTFDRPSDEHTHVAELAIERAKRLVELGKDVVIVLDGITRLARAYNLAAPTSGRIMSGGVDSTALYPPKRFFGAARNVEEGGSLTIVATALIETGSKMDEVIFEEFKGTGNMELRLDRRLSERRIYPAIDVEASGTRHEELLFDRNELQQVWKLRRVLNALDGGAGLELLAEKIRTTKSNAEFLGEIAKAPSPGG